MGDQGKKAKKKKRPEKMAKRRKKSRRREGEAREVPERVEAWGSGVQREEVANERSSRGGERKGHATERGSIRGEPPKPTPEPRIPKPTLPRFSLLLFIQMIPLEKRRTPSRFDSVAVVFPPFWPEVGPS